MAKEWIDTNTLEDMLSKLSHAMNKYEQGPRRQQIVKEYRILHAIVSTIYAERGDTNERKQLKDTVKEIAQLITMVG